MNIKNEHNFQNDLNNYVCLKTITKNSSGRFDLDNQFAVFKTIDNLYLLVYFNDDNDIYCYNITKNISKKVIKKAFSKEIKCIKHFYDSIQNRNLIVTSARENKIKIFNVNNNFELILTINNIEKKMSLFGEYYNINCVELFEYEKKIYIIVSNYEDLDFKLFSFENNGQLISNVQHRKQINCVYFFIDKINNNTPYLIFSGNAYYISSFSFLTLTLYKIYLDSDKCYYNISVKIKEFKNNNLLICASGGRVKIFDFNNANIIYNIYNKSFKSLNSISIWNDEFILGGGNDKNLHLINFKNGKYIKPLYTFKDRITTIKKLYIEDYGEYFFVHSEDGEINLFGQPLKK